MPSVRFVSPLPTPASDRLLSTPRTSEQWRSTFKEIKKLYLQCCYKKCSARCEQLLDRVEAQSNQIHPLRRAYLLFFIAICYESLGLAAYSLSSKKLTYLEKARAAFVAVGLTLGQAAYEGDPFDSKVRQENTIASSSLSADDFDNLKDVNMTPMAAIAPSSPDRANVADHIDQQFGVPITSFGNDQVDDWHPVVCSTSSIQTYNKHYLTQEKRSTGEEASALIPKPLTIKKKIPQLSNIPPPRPLPPIPVRSPKRLLQQRKPAIPTLMNPYIPSPRSKPLPPPPIWTLPINDLDTLTTYLRHRSINHYNTLLSSFHPQINSHISQVNELIATTTFLRADHQAQKAKDKRLASFWALNNHPASSPSSTLFPHTLTSPSPSPVIRSSIQLPSRNSKRLSTLTTLRLAPDDTETDSTVTSGDKKAKRIEKLRANGWKVRKEDKGWKGNEYYEGVRRRALGECEMGGGGDGRFLL